MSELTESEIAVMLPRLAERTALYDTAEEQAIVYKRAVAILKGPDEPFLANIEDLTLEQKIKAAEKILSNLKLARKALGRATSCV
ncbi:hypothetical protein LMG33818_000014 [Halomonadaceae bacterium LMG 33818]|uniref:hypothetical protein n=1 Tax=Cernens ardua TaxID=3402176 RepID=UPI003EDBB8F6